MPKNIEKPWVFTKFQSDFSQLTLKLTNESMQVFEQAKPAQGFIGLLDLKSGNIHLVPCFNYPKSIRENHLDENGEDDLKFYSQWRKDPKYVANKNNELFSVISATGKKRSSYYVTTIDDLGTNTGVAHGNAVALAGLSSYAGEFGGVVGFGVWKGHDCLIEEFRDRSASQNRFAITYSYDFLGQFLTDKYREYDPQGHQLVKVSKARSLPQEISDKIMACLIEELPCEENVIREIKIDDRVFSFPNPFISAVEEGDRELMKAYLDKGTNINDIGNLNKWTALHACANLEEDNPTKMLMLRDLLNNDFVRYDIPDEDGNCFDKYLTKNEMIKVLIILNEKAKNKQAEEILPIIALLKKCIEEAIYSKKTKMIGSILSVIDFRLLTLCFPNGRFWTTISSSEYSLDTKAKAQLTNVLDEKLKSAIFDLHKKEMSIGTALRDIALSLENSENLSFKECEKLQLNLTQLQEHRQALEQSANFFLNRTQRQLIHARKGLHALPDCYSKYEKIIKLEEKIRLALNNLIDNLKSKKDKQAPKLRR